jgi:hypothetical protein
MRPCASRRAGRSPHASLHPVPGGVQRVQSRSIRVLAVYQRSEGIEGRAAIPKTGLSRARKRSDEGAGERDRGREDQQERPHERRDAVLVRLAKGAVVGEEREEAEHGSTGYGDETDKPRRAARPKRDPPGRPRDADQRPNDEERSEVAPRVRAARRRLAAAAAAGRPSRRQRGCASSFGAGGRRRADSRTARIASRAGHWASPYPHGDIRVHSDGQALRDRERRI